MRIDVAPAPVAMVPDAVQEQVPRRGPEGSDERRRPQRPPRNEPIDQFVMGRLGWTHRPLLLAPVHGGKFATCRLYGKLQTCRHVRPPDAP
jgi:hypothetical protein